METKTLTVANWYIELGHWAERQFTCISKYGREVYETQIAFVSRIIQGQPMDEVVSITIRGGL